jgi:hypothetical protein
VTTVQIIGAVFGFLIIAVTVWKIVSFGVARSNRKVESWDGITIGRNSEWDGDGFPPA